MIRFEHITKKYKNKIVLNDISLEIEKGKLVTLIGASGCGKTTTLKMINRLIKPSSGTIFIKDENIEEKDVIELRRNMGYVIQQTGLFPHMTIRENIELIPKIQKKDSNDISQKTYELMNMVGLNPEEYLERYPTELSGGQQQRVGVARAFATEPDIILMDEPFSALDPITRLNLQEELVNLQAEFKKTIIFVTHDMDEAIRISDKICIMKDGEILQYDTPENILKNPSNEFVTEFVGKNRIWTAPEYIKSKDIMIDNPVTCTKGMTIQLAIEKMRAYKVDSLMVVDKHTKELLGIVRAKKIRSIVDRTKEVATIMEKDIISTSPEDSIIDVLKIVDENDISFIPVLDDSRALLGLITKSSLITTLSEQFLEAEEVL